MQSRAWWIVLFWAAVAAAGAWYTATHARINTDTAAMLSADLPFRQAYERYRVAFPRQVDALVAVVDAPTPEQADAAAAMLAARLRGRADLFTDVEAPAAEPYFARNALLYLEADELASLAERLIAAEPFIGLLNREPNLHGFADTLRRILRETSISDATAEPLLGELARATTAELRGEPYATSWRRLISGGDSPTVGPARALVLVKPVLDWGDVLAADRPIAAIRAAAAELQLGPATGHRVRITGDAALAYEEIRSALGGGQVSIALALTVITIVLGMGLRSARMTVAALLTLLTGLALTGAFATWAVRELNLLSFAAVVLYLGLGVDYAIHFCLRYREALGGGWPKATALRHATRGVRRPLLLCAAATATGFYAFVPTDFAGVAQLGLICGTGMFINLLVTLSLLPALLALLPAPPAVPAATPRASGGDPVLERHALAIAGLAAALAAGALLALPLASFDRNPLNLRHAGSESVATLHDLRGDPAQPMSGITVLAADERSAQQLASALRALPTVREVLTVAEVRSPASAGKLAIIDELAILLGPALTSGARPAAATDSRTSPAALQELREELGRQLDGGSASGGAARLAFASLTELLRRPAPEQVASIAAIERSLLGTLPSALQALRTALRPDPPAAGLPATISRRWVAPEGTHRVAVYPREVLDDDAALRRFVDSVQAIAPDATDEPVLNVRAGDAIVGAFQQALTVSVAVIVALLLALFRSVLRAALALTPLVLAGILTVASLGLAGVPFNFANVIALPLLLGANVDNGIHMVHRYHDEPRNAGPLLRTSTSRAIVFSGLANLCGFANLLASPHPGTASMGLVLTIGMAWTLLTTLVIVPALLIRTRRRAQPA